MNITLNPKSNNSEDNHITDMLKKHRLRVKFGLFSFIICSLTGFAFLFTALSFNPGLEIVIAIIFIISVSIIIMGLIILYTIGLNSRRLLFYYNIIKSIHFDQVTIDLKYIICIKDDILIIYKASLHGIYLLPLECLKPVINSMTTSEDKKPKRLPNFKRLNKKVSSENIKIKYAEFKGNFKVLINKDNYIAESTMVLLMPLILASRTQIKRDHIIEMIDIAKKTLN
ncbi:MAG: hypothetical protein EAX89_05455 [Candidatus Lokiarchaeota archaeon]|nr:hypothetical protein [Candidatus Lokiarchaeota archaeon]